LSLAGANGFGAGDRIRTGDIDLGKVALYQLSYSRIGAPVREETQTTANILPPGQDNVKWRESGVRPPRSVGIGDVPKQVTALVFQTENEPGLKCFTNGIVFVTK
jgi:hypothetical protein